jgi:hypothetical protein
LIIAGVFAVIGIAAFAGTCTVTHIKLTKIGTHDTFAGQVDNNSGVNILQHNFVVAFLDSSNNVVDTKTVEGCLRSIQNGESDFFSAASVKDSSVTATGLARIAFDSTFKVGAVDSSNITISGITVQREGTTLKVRGTIKNNDSVKIDDPHACAVVHDTDGNVLIVGTDTGINDLSHNATDTFEITMTVPDNVDDVDEVTVYVDAISDDTDIPVAPEASSSKPVSICPTKTNTPTSPAMTNTPTVTSTATNTPGAGTSTVTNTSVPATATPCP